MSDWLPITVRNRVALGFAFAALVMFVVWNALPNHSAGSTEPMGKIWVDIFDPDTYFQILRYPDMDGFLAVSLFVSLFLHGLVVFTIIPFWRIIHSSNCLKIPLAVPNIAGGLIVLWYIGEEGAMTAYQFVSILLIALTMFTLSAALFIFKNELALRHELEVRKVMDDTKIR